MPPFAQPVSTEAQPVKRRSATRLSPLQQPEPGSFSDTAAWLAVDPELDAQPLIMMIDDEPTTTEVLQMFLEASGYRNFLVSNDSREALALMRRDLPDIVLLDLMMPEVGGFDILQAMRDSESLCHTPVIILTSSVDAETKLTALQLGATDFLGKPVDPSELALRLRNTLRAKAHQDRLALCDKLTGLPNRMSFQTRLTKALEMLVTSQQQCAVMHIDPARFKKINDSFGHAMGDLVLKAIAQRLEGLILLGDKTLESVPSADPFVARLGGDEFVIVLPDQQDVMQVSRLAEQVRSAFDQPFNVANEELFVALGIGIAIAPQDGSDADTLLQNASAATTSAKHNRSKRPEFYARHLNESVSDRLRLETLLYKALEREQLFLVYQPKICVASGRVLGAEALLRWQLPDRGLVSPVDFIPIAEETGLIVQIGAAVIEQACAQLSDWATRGLADLHLAVNVSSLQFQAPGFVEQLDKALRQGRFDPAALTIEITESLLLDSTGESSQKLQRIRALGPKVSIDDFGTGYSSLSYLRQYPIDELKIDRSFLFGLPAERGNRAIVEAVVHLAHGLNLSVVAEGVETVPQLEFLRSVGCNQMQGFLANKGVAVAEFLHFVQRHRAHGWQPSTHTQIAS
jgi:diguanylate cyclase